MARRPLAVLRLAEFLGHVGKALGVTRGGAGGGVDHCHDLLDFAHDLMADLVDALSQPRRRQIGLVNLIEIGIGNHAA